MRELALCMVLLAVVGSGQDLPRLPFSKGTQTLEFGMPQAVVLESLREGYKVEPLLAGHDDVFLISGHLRGLPYNFGRVEFVDGTLSAVEQNFAVFSYHRSASKLDTSAEDFFEALYHVMAQLSRGEPAECTIITDNSERTTLHIAQVMFKCQARNAPSYITVERRNRPSADEGIIKIIYRYAAPDGRPVRQTN